MARKGEDTSLGLPVTFFAHTTHYTATLFSTLCTFHRSLTYLTGFSLIRVRWCNLAAFGLKKKAGGSVTSFSPRKKSMISCHIHPASVKVYETERFCLSLDGEWKWYTLRPQAKKRIKKHFGQRARDF